MAASRTASVLLRGNGGWRSSPCFCWCSWRIALLPFFHVPPPKIVDQFTQLLSGGHAGAMACNEPDAPDVVLLRDDVREPEADIQRDVPAGNRLVSGCRADRDGAAMVRDAVFRSAGGGGDLLDAAGLDASALGVMGRAGFRTVGVVRNTLTENYLGEAWWCWEARWCWG